MSYRNDAARLGALVEPDRVHRDVYLDPEVFSLEMERLWARSWVYVGHISQVPAPGDYWATTLAAQPVFLLNRGNGEYAVYRNRCAHKGAQVVLDTRGNVGRQIRCPYHAWNYRLDGSLASLPLKNDYLATNLWQSETGQGLGRPAAVQVYRGLVFARLSPEGEEFASYAGDMLGVLDRIADRSPEGELEVAGPPLLSEIRCNWKMYLENVNDAVHPISAHESAAKAAKWVGEQREGGDDHDLVMEQLLPFGASYSFYTKMGARVLPNGHSIHGTHFSLHSNYAGIPGYREQLVAAHGADRADDVLSFSPQNTILYPSLVIKAKPAMMRVMRPIAADRVIVEVWALVPKGAPEALRRQSVNYTRLVFSPFSVVAHDDIRLFESAQLALRASGNPWVSLHRGFRSAQTDAQTQDVEDGNDEILMRNQFRAWAKGMMPSPEAA